MKKYIVILVVIVLNSCTKQNTIEQANLSFQFNHVWDAQMVTSADFNQFKYTTEHGETISIERLRYVVSNITLTLYDDETLTFDNYYLIDVTNDNNLTFTLPSSIPVGNYQNIAFTFGFTNEDNIDGIYPDLNVTNFNVGSMLGGGYHYIQFDGKYINDNNEQAPFNYHAIRAADASDMNNLVLEDTSFTINLGEIAIPNSTTIIIESDLSEWFKNPNTWNLNELNTTLMPNFEAQKLMYQNGQSVFRLDNVVQ